MRIFFAAFATRRAIERAVARIIPMEISVVHFLGEEDIRKLNAGSRTVVVMISDRELLGPGLSLEKISK